MSILKHFPRSIEFNYKQYNHIQYAISETTKLYSRICDDIPQRTCEFCDTCSAWFTAQFECRLTRVVLILYLCNIPSFGLTFLLKFYLARRPQHKSEKISSFFSFLFSPRRRLRLQRQAIGIKQYTSMQTYKQAFKISYVARSTAEADQLWADRRRLIYWRRSACCWKWSLTDERRCTAPDRVAARRHSFTVIGGVDDVLLRWYSFFLPDECALHTDDCGHNTTIAGAIPRSLVCECTGDAWRKSWRRCHITKDKFTRQSRPLQPILSTREFLSVTLTRVLPGVCMHAARSCRNWPPPEERTDKNAISVIFCGWCSLIWPPDLSWRLVSSMARSVPRNCLAKC